MSFGDRASGSSDSSNISGIFFRFFIAFCFLVLYRLGTYVPIPYVDGSVLKSFFDSSGGGIAGMFNVFSGGAVSRAAVFSLNVMPYIVSSIVLQLLSFSVPYLKSVSETGSRGRRSIAFYTRCMTIVLSLLQGVFILSGIEVLFASGSSESVYSAGLFEKVVSLTTLLGGVISVIWIGDKITSLKIGNGISIIILIGVVSELPSSFSALFSLAKVDSFAFIVISFLLLFAFCLVLFVEKSVRKVDIVYPRRVFGNKMQNSSMTHIPLKINMSGVIPPIFAGAFLSFPITILSMFRENDFVSYVRDFLLPGSLGYLALYMFFVVFFCFFYVEFVFNADDVAKNIKSSGGIVTGRRPGKATAGYLSQIVKRVTFFGASYIFIVCLIPELIKMFYNVPFYIGGTSVMIMVTVVLDIMLNVGSYFMSMRYKSVYSKVI